MLNRFASNGRAALIALIFSAHPVIGYSAPAAQVDFSVGNVTATGPGGKSRTLGKGAQIEQGDTVNTNGGRAQLRFTDGAYVSLQPESQFRIDQYRYDGKQDGDEKGIFSLLKGGLRTITGLVGRSNKQNYQITTSVATIGIRGTEYTIQYGNSITGTVGEGQIEVCNGAGCLSVTNGESYYVQGQEVKPILTNKRTDLPPPEPQSPPSSFAQGEHVDQAGSTNIFTLVGDQTVTSALVSGAVSVSTGIPVVFDSNGALTGLDSVTDVGNDGIIAWGRGTSTTGACSQCLAVFVKTTLISPDPWTHYVVGLPMTQTDVSNMALNRPIATFALIGGTTPTVLDGSTGVLSFGTLTGGSIKADFSRLTVDASVSLSIASQSITATASGMSIIPDATGTRFNSTLTSPGSCAVGGATGSCSMAGFFSGPNAMRAGLAYDVSTLGVRGVAAFSKLP